MATKLEEVDLLTRDDPLETTDTLAAKCATTLTVREIYGDDSVGYLISH